MRFAFATPLLAALATATQDAAALKIDEFDWSSVEASAKLNYTACYDGHKCAKLLVPLDWLDLDNPERVSLAIIARPAVVDEDDASFGGTIITNPGGPGGSGLSHLLQNGELLQRTADGANKKFEVLSFDPRGMGLSTPAADCFNGDGFARSAFDLEARALGRPNHHEETALRQLFSRSEGLGRLCEGKESIRAFMGTSSVARDMVEIVDRLHELRHGEADSKGVDVEGGKGQQDRQMKELRSEKGDDTPRILYWGFSYGTVLGRHFASLFPGRIGRMMLEGVVDMYDYTNTFWAGNLVDTQKALDFLWETCHEAGSRCALYRDDDKTPQDIEDRVREFMSDLDASPVPYISGNRVVIITKQDIIDVLFNSLYHPGLRFSTAAEAIAAAIEGNYTTLYRGIELPNDRLRCPIEPPRPRPGSDYAWRNEAGAAVLCGDGEPQGNLTMAGFGEYLAHLERDSPDFGPRWSLIRMRCPGWRVRPKYRYTGPWTTPEPTRPEDPLVKGRPAAPLLFVSSTFDPVTPLRWARAAREGHPRSGLLVQDSVGHGAAMVPGRCREERIKRYLEVGEVPSEGTLCQPDCRNPFLCGSKDERFWAAGGGPLSVN